MAPGMIASPITSPGVRLIPSVRVNSFPGESGAISRTCAAMMAKARAEACVARSAGKIMLISDVPIFESTAEREDRSAHPLR